MTEIARIKYLTENDVLENRVKVDSRNNVVVDTTQVASVVPEVTEFDTHMAMGRPIQALKAIRKILDVKRTKTSIL